jgi:hypothetical protein
MWLLKVDVTAPCPTQYQQNKTYFLSIALPLSSNLLSPISPLHIYITSSAPFLSLIFFSLELVVIVDWTKRRNTLIHTEKASQILSKLNIFVSTQSASLQRQRSS